MSKAITIKLSELDIKNIDIIKEELGVQAITEIIRYSLSTASKKLRPPYSQPRPPKEDEPKQTPLEVKRQLAEQLYEPKFETSLNGETQVTWTVYEKIGKRVLTGPMTKSLQNIIPVNIETQFKGGTKEEILAIIKKQK